jgi:hypothetical protein
MFSFISCTRIPQYKKTNSTQISIPSELPNMFDGIALEQIEWYLAASNEWEFTKIRDKTSAQYKVEDISKPYVDMTVFTAGFFDTGAAYEPFQTVTSSADVLDLNVYKLFNPFEGEMRADKYYSGVVIKFSETFFIRFDEYSYDAQRNLTLEAIRNILKLFGSKSEQENELKSNCSIKDNKEFLDVERNKYGGYDISGFVHLSEKNQCRIKVIDVQTKEVYFDQLTDANSEFFIGWSSADNECFYFHQDLTIKRRVDSAWASLG